MSVDSSPNPASNGFPFFFLAFVSPFFTGSGPNKFSYSFTGPAAGFVAFPAAAGGAAAAGAAGAGSFDFVDEGADDWIIDYSV